MNAKNGCPLCGCHRGWLVDSLRDPLWRYCRCCQGEFWIDRGELVGIAVAL